ncbi:DUF1801 domain-containing protein [Pseudoxanthomonas sp. z9]|uniref:DUF1801 domain-containing protein n=1 Tax=Pseudoxanthomonas sp. z9 TaxID=2584942 RepID=UPI001141C48C|nr:DUF1801 domain-containing protein [Pseudoxanthomonas sp. z9]
MPRSEAATVEAYLAGLPEERRDVITTVRDAINRHLPPGYEERMNWGMISWEIPLSRYPETYNRQPLSFVALAAQKNHYALYLMCVHADSPVETELRRAYAEAGKKLDMGKSCLRFKRLEDLLLPEVVRIVAATPVEAHIARHEAGRVRN